MNTKLKEILKGERAFTVTELLHTWKVTWEIGNARVEYKISKETAPDVEALEKYVQQNELF